MKKMLYYSVSVVAFITLVNSSLSSQVVYWGDSTTTKAIRVYISNDCTIADLNVFYVDSINKILTDGHFYVTSDLWRANYRLVETNSQALSDLTIYIVAAKEKAGWMNRNKRYLFVVRKNNM
jgi:hypothetical protein